MNNNNNKNFPASQRGRGRRTRRRQRRRNNNIPRSVTSGYRTSVPFSNQFSMPDSTIVDLPFSDTTLVFNPAGSTFGQFRYRGNSPFDPDVLLGGESALYYAVYSSMYRRYRVISVKVECTFVNNETFPVFITYAPTDTDQSASLSSNARCLDLGEMPYAVRPLLLGPVGSMNRVSFSRVVRWPKFVGNRQSYMGDDLYSAFNNANPANTTILQFTAFATTNFSAGITRYVRIIYRTLWTDRNQTFASLRVYHQLKNEEDDCDCTEE